MISDPAAVLEGLHAVDVGEQVVFSEVGERCVSPLERLLARAILGQAAAALGIEPPELRWFDVESDEERAYAERYHWRDWCWFPGDPRLLGLYVRPFGELWLRRGLEPIETARTVAHECAHAAQAVAVDGRGEREEKAERFAYEFASTFTTKGV